MEVEDLKWYSPPLFFVGAIFSFADPITDILTLVQFYRTDHKTSFGVGLTFVLVPWLVYPVLFFVLRRGDDDNLPSHYTKTVVCAFHPFSAAFARIEAFIFCLKICCFEDDIDGDTQKRGNNLLLYIHFAVLFEAVLESAPQFIIQLYAISVQEDPPATIQLISLPVSFFTLAWAFTTTDELNNCDILPSGSNLKVKIVLYTTHLLLLSSRLLAICYFTVSYKWWVVAVLSLHSCVVVVAILICRGRSEATDVLSIIFFMGIHTLRDDASGFFVEGDANVKINLLSHILFVIGNCVMILIFYFSDYVKTWYSVPLTVCVCVFSAFGSIMRIYLLNRLRNNAVDN